MSAKVSPWVCTIELYDLTRHKTKAEAIARALEKVKLQRPTRLRWKVYFDDGTKDEFLSPKDPTLVMGLGEEVVHGSA